MAITLTLFEEPGIKESIVSSGDDSMENSKPKNRANSLDGKTWTRNSISIWSDIRKTQEEISLKHPAMFPVALVTRLIECFTKGGDGLIFDPFVGMGTTVLAAKQLGKRGIGTELSEDFAQIANQRVQQGNLLDDENKVGEGIVLHANALDLLKYVEKQSVDMVVTSPPYWDILNRNRSADYKEIRHYGNYENDLGSIQSYEEFLQSLQAVFIQVFSAMKPGAYCCVVVMDIRKKEKFYPFHADVASLMQTIGFIYDDLIIWDRRHEYNNMRPLGYPAVFRINKAHEFILIFQKSKSGGEQSNGTIAS